MGPEGEGRNPGDREGSGQEESEDLFEDLDKFFAPIDDDDWPELDEPAAASSVEPEPPLGAGATLDEGDEPDDAEEEPYGEGMVSEVAGFETGPATTPGPPPPAEPRGLGGTAEMTGAEWTRLRDVLGDDDEDEAEELSSFGAEEPAAREELGAYTFGEGVQDVDEPGVVGAETDLPPDATDLTVDDLRQAPPEYEELPTEGPEPYQAGRGRMDLGDPFAPVGAAEEGPLFPEASAEEDLLADLERPPAARTVKVGDPEAMTGPTWEEPSSRALMGDTRGEREAGRNLPAAVVSAFVLGVVFLIALFADVFAGAVVVTLVVILGQFELYVTMQRRNYQPATALGLVLGVFMLGAAYFKGEAAMLFVVGLSVVLTSFWYMAAAPKSRTGSVGNIGATIFGLLYVPFLGGYVLMLLTQAPSGRALLLTVLGLTFLYDIAGFAFGTIWGTRPLAPTISPKKSWEGLTLASLATLFTALAVVPSALDYLTFSKAAVLAIVILVFAPLGDLAESALKRDLGVKDMGTVIPGHGGVLDRVDSLLFVAPAAYYLLKIIF